MSGNEACQIMVFRPTYDEFKDFSAYIKKIESEGAHKAGLAKVIPPKEWHAARSYNPYDIGEMVIEAPVGQIVNGQQGLFQQYNVQKKPMKVKDFKELAESQKYKGPEDSDLENIERKYWKNITFNAPIYGADMPGSLYDRSVKIWNINRLNTILDTLNEDCSVKILGVNTAYLYFGMWKATFPWHTEDMDLYSINYLHFGAPKSWYAIPPEHGKRLETLAKGFFPGSASECPEFLRHKMTIISPQVLRRFSIPFNKITQYEGEFMITFPFGYHSGYNHGYNCAESTNFASLRWIDFGKRASHCKCDRDSVKIDMNVFIKKYQPEIWEKLQSDNLKLDKDNQSRTPKQNRAAPRARYASESPKKKKRAKPQTITLSSSSSSSSSEQSSDSEADSEEESEEVTDSDDSDIQESIRTKKPPVNKSPSKFKSPSKSKSSPKKVKGNQNSDKGRPGSSKSNVQCSKRHPISPTKLINKSLVATNGSDLGQTSFPLPKKVTVKVLPPLKSDCFCPSLDGLWCNQPPDLEKDKAYNILLSSGQVKCAICVFFSPVDAVKLNGNSKNVEDEGGGLLELKPRDVCHPLVTELCFGAHRTEHSTVETAFNLMFGNKELQKETMLTCEMCHVTVHKSCYGVPQVESYPWRCDQCHALQMALFENGVEYIRCSLCCLRGGALKRTTTGGWAHVVCAIGCPDVNFESRLARGPIDITGVSPARKKLVCLYCKNQVARNSIVERGACVQCKCGKCAESFHITCSFHNGIPMFLGDWPIMIETYCQKHAKHKNSKPEEKRELPEVEKGNSVFAKHKNGRYYKSTVLDKMTFLYYKVIFADKSFCFDLPPQDIQGIDAKSNIIETGQFVDVLWTDEETYKAEVTGHWFETMLQVRFEDGSILNLKRRDAFLPNEEIPKRILSKVSYASVTANHLALPESEKSSSPPKRSRVGSFKACAVHEDL